MENLERTVLGSLLFLRLVDMEEAERLEWLESLKCPAEEGMTRPELAESLSQGQSDLLLETYEEVRGRPWEKPYKSLAGEGWNEGRFPLFLSHSSKDKEFVSDVAKALTHYAIDAFVAHEDIEPMKPWVVEIERHLESCHAAVAFLSQDFHPSHWTDQEIGHCLGRGLPVIPVRMGADPHGFLSTLQAQSLGTLDHGQLAEEI